jgi:hypothetical protein
MPPSSKAIAAGPKARVSHQISHCLSARLSAVALLFALLLAPSIAKAGGASYPAPPQAKPACAGGNAVIGYLQYGSPLLCGTATANGSIANGSNQIGVYIGTNTIGPLTPSGDIGFSSPNFTVKGLQGEPLSATAPTAGQILEWNGSVWIPSAAPTSGLNALTQDVSATGIGSQPATVVGLQTRPLAATAPTSGQLMGWDGSTWGPVTSPTSGINALTQDVTATGTGSQAATVVGLQGRPLASTAPTSNQLIGWNGSAWAPVTAPTSGINALTQDVSASGTGSQVATVVGLQTRPVASTAPTLGQCLIWNGSAWAPGTCGTAPTVSYVLRNGGGFVARNGGGSVERNGA